MGNGLKCCGQILVERFSGFSKEKPFFPRSKKETFILLICKRQQKILTLQNLSICTADKPSSYLRTIKTFYLVPKLEDLILAIDQKFFKLIEFVPVANF